MNIYTGTDQTDQAGTGLGEPEVNQVTREA